MSGQAETALRHDVPWITATVVAIQSEQESQGKPIITVDPPPVPDADPDRELIWTVGFSTVRIKLWALLALPAVAPDTPLDARNSIVHSVGSTLCMLARSTSPSQFLFSADVAGNYTVEIAVSSIDLEPWARRSNAGERIPAEKLPSQWLTAGLDVLHNGPAESLIISHADEDASTSFSKLAPTFDLDDDENQTGELHVTMTVTINRPARPTHIFGFGTELEDSHTFDAVVFASTVSALDRFVSGGARERLEITHSVELHESSNNMQGTVRLYLAKDGNNELGYFLRYHNNGSVTEGLKIGAVMEVAFSKTDAPAAATSSSGHVGPLIATLAIPAITLAANANPAAAWVLASGAPDEFSLPSPNRNGKLNVSRILPDTMAGVVVRTKVSGTKVSQVFLPWLPNLEDVAHNAQIGPGLTGRNVFQLLVSDDSTPRTVKLVLERKWNGDNDLLSVWGNGEAIKPNTSIELYQWV